jgi:3'-phosphoadenosine 5'-phosphosulfate sulfotransferase (PAPS reductase)/FAD synthetase
MTTHALTDEDREHLTPLIVASVSGGKDSAALSLWLTELGLEHRRVFANTQWEAQETYDYLRGPLTAALGPIDEVSGPRGFEELAIHKGMFPSRLKRFCTTELKVRPIQCYIKALDDDLVSAVGIRANESAPRAKMTRWEWSESFDCWVWRPLLTWTLDDVIAIHKRHGLLPNPLYLKGASRVGCWPCINSRKSEIALVADTDPARIDQIRALEQRVGDAASARAEKRAEEGKEPFVFRNRPTMFHSHRRQQPNAGTKAPCTACAGTGVAHDYNNDAGQCITCAGTGVIHTKVPLEDWVPDVPIDDIVKWARTSRGGRQYQLDLGPSDEGCTR